MKQKFTALALSLALSLGLCAPAMAAESGDPAAFQMQDTLVVQSAAEYGPYTITGTHRDDPGYTYTLSFDAAKVQKVKLHVQTRYYDETTDQEISRSDSWEEVNLIMLKPGSTITAEDNGAMDSVMEPGAVSTGYYGGTKENGMYVFKSNTQDQSFDIYGGDLIWSGPVEKTFDNFDLIRVGDYYLTIGDMEGTAEGESPSFTDVKADAYYADAVSWAVRNGITTGTTATTFSPNNTCTVAQVTTFLYRANGSPDMSLSGGDFYEDVTPNDWYVDAANWAYNEGLSVGRFGGNDPCTRGMVVTYLWILAGKPSAGTSGFSDVPDDLYCAEAVAWAIQKGITSGTTATTFSPNATCTRGQVMTFLYRDMAN